MNDRSRKSVIGLNHALNGLREAIRTERNLRLHLVCALLVTVAGFAVRLEAAEWAIIMLANGMVLTAELVNTVVEKMMDYLKPDTHPSAKVIKDIAAGAVFIAAFFAAAAGLFIFLSKLYT
ncbi:diacylglycerol kinase family protein [Lentibacillus cibarius]|uniref:Diacylglycerol kinase family protein n=1 Tax=Lentibacillus cibarius TaxID=2583219 RepID=A0A5S3QGE6_9BACI|nr:diacylglycerol kinase family protein [Lentibacillus cibarius]TMN20994.1 diacylglycerol kinase family protein [Lentibacillus cibarius]